MDKPGASIFFLILFGCFSAEILAQAHIGGFVKDQLSGERLIGAHVQEKGTDNVVATNGNGYFSIKVMQNLTFQVSYIGYKTFELQITSSKDSLITIFLQPSDQLDEIVVSSAPLQQPFVSTFNSKELNALPSLGAKPDVVKTLQLLPGILPQNEGSSRLIVRGGTPGENLFLIDNIPLIYVNHLGGFASVFNPDIINKIDVYKGSFPARFGGKLSSVVDITQKEGNISGRHGSFSIGVTDASLTLEGPTEIRNSSYIFTARKTMVDALLAMASGFSPSNSFILSYGFHDINGKFSWKPNTANSLHFNFYQGDDYLNYWTKKGQFPNGETGRLTNVWGNWLFSARWHRLVSARLYGVSSLSHSRYRLKESRLYSIAGQDQSEYNASYRSSVRDISFRSDWNYEVLPKWTFDFGLQSTLFIHTPNDSYRSTDLIQVAVETIQSVESALYLDNKVRFPGEVELNAGGRLANYVSGNYSNISFEPRLRLIVPIHGSHFIHTSYMRVNQYAHLLFSQGSINNVDVWVPAGSEVPQSLSDQYSVGWSWQFADGSLQFSVDAYHKSLSQLATYREGYFNLIGDNSWRAKVLTGGNGNSRGIEFSARRSKGDWTGFVNYTLSNTRYQFPEINNGEDYVFEYDRPHSATVSIGRKLSENWAVSLTWIYQTGLPYTPAIGRMLVPETSSNYFENGHYEALIYGERNSARMKDYHRLDLAFVKKGQSKKRKLPTELTFALYNAYNRRNPYYYYYSDRSGSEIWRPEDGNALGKLSLYQRAFFPIIPSMSYKVYFRQRNEGISDKKRIKEKTNKLLYH